MATGVTLADMSRQTRAILGMSLNTAHGVDQEEALREGLRRTQSDLWVLHDWPMLIVRKIKDIAQGVRVITLPTEIDFDHVNSVATRKAAPEKWTELEYGIGLGELNTFDSDGDVRSDPIRNWQADASSPMLIEVWPIPASPQQLMFVGRAKLKPLTVNTDVCTLDSDLIISTYAGQQLARQDSKDAQIQLTKAQTILNRLRGRQGASKRKPFVIQTSLGGD